MWTSHLGNRLLSGRHSQNPLIHLSGAEGFKPGPRAHAGSCSGLSGAGWANTARGSDLAQAATKRETLRREVITQPPPQKEAFPPPESLSQILADS